jgi:tRNA A37 threonylcarbamoyladenosine dehydratase
MTIIPSMAINPFFQRLALLTGEKGLEALAQSRVLVFGLGGVGSWAAEALVRSGVGHIGIVDSDTICVTNINRQSEATVKTVGKFKTEAMAERLRDINPQCKVEIYNKVFEKESAPDFALETSDYVIDAIDSLRCKLDLIELCTQIYAARGRAKLFASMGTACKLDPTRLKVGDIWESKGCPLARYVRQGLRKRGYGEKAGPGLKPCHFQVVYSEEQLSQDKDIPVSCGTGACLCHIRIGAGGKLEANSEDKHASGQATEWCSKKAVINGSAMPVTATAGMILASMVIRDRVAHV